MALEVAKVNGNVEAAGTRPGTPLPLGARRMLIPLEVAMVALDTDEDGVAAMAEDGTLWPCWNLAARKIHVWRKCLEGNDIPRGSLDRIIAEALPRPVQNREELDWLFGKDAPGPPPVVRATELAWRFCCSKDLIARLIAQGEITAGRDARRKAKESPKILYASVTEFLKRRLLQ